jgi:hypothetical protein
MFISFGPIFIAYEFSRIRDLLSLVITFTKVNYLPDLIVDWYFAAFALLCFKIEPDL